MSFSAAKLTACLRLDRNPRLETLSLRCSCSRRAFLGGLLQQQINGRLSADVSLCGYLNFPVYHTAVVVVGIPND